MDFSDSEHEAEIVAALVKAIERSDPQDVRTAFYAVSNAWLLRLALKSCTKLERVTQDMKMLFLQIWIEFGESIRSQVDDDITVIKALRQLLPAYDGQSLKLYRGESLGNRQRRTYGMSWSSDRGVAEQFARNVADRYAGGTVLLETIAPSEAIISAPGLLLAEVSVNEYVVDRRKLGTVGVVGRYH